MAGPLDMSVPPRQFLPALGSEFGDGKGPREVLPDFVSPSAITPRFTRSHTKKLTESVLELSSSSQTQNSEQTVEPGQLT